MAVAIGFGVYEFRQLATARMALRRLAAEPLVVPGQSRPLVSQYAVATNNLAEALAEIDRLGGGSRDREMTRLRREKEQLQGRLLAAAGASNSAALMPPLWRELYQHPDLTQAFNFQTTGTNVGQATPAAVVQTWLWALRHGSELDMQNIWDFAPGIPESVKRDTFESASRQPPKGPGFFYYQLVALFPLGDDEYYAWIAEISDEGGISWVMKKTLRQEGGEWKMYYDPKWKEVPE